MRLSDIKKVLSESDIALSKNLGQHLLIDENVRRRFVEAIGLSAGDVVIEIGPGTGLLTEILAESGAHTIAVEIDKGLARLLSKRFQGNEKVRIVHEDIMKCDLAKLLEEVPGPRGKTHFMGNLPYNLNSPIMGLLTESRVPFADCTFIVQKEISERYTAKPASKLYSVISIFIQYHYSVELLFDIDPQCFYPVPNIQSAAIRLVPHDTRPVQATDEKLFFRLVRAAFGQRRKMLRNTLRNLPEVKANEELLSAAFASTNVNPQERPEKLSIAQFAALANALTTHKED